MSCHDNHRFTCKVDITLFTELPGQGMVQVSGHCVDCGVPFIFQGPRGTGNEARASFDRTELRAPVGFGRRATYKPIPTVAINGPEMELQ